MNAERTGSALTFSLAGADSSARGALRVPVAGVARPQMNSKILRLRRPGPARSVGAARVAQPGVASSSQASGAGPYPPVRDNPLPCLGAVFFRAIPAPGPFSWPSTVRDTTALPGAGIPYLTGSE